MSLYIISLDGDNKYMLGWVELNEAKPNTQAADSKDMHKYKESGNQESGNTDIISGELYNCNSINTIYYISIYGAKTEKITNDNTFPIWQHIIPISIWQWDPLS